MVTLGNAMLYASIVISAAGLFGLLLKEFKKEEVLTKLVTPAILLSAGLLTFAYLLLTYYFVVSDFSYKYVSQWSSRDLPLIYKISGTWGGQEGTYLLWVLVIFLSAAWLVLKTDLATPLARRTLIMTLLVGIFFIALSIIQTPFSTWLEFFNQQAVTYGVSLENVIRFYELQYPQYGLFSMETGFTEGAGLNIQLVNFWMAIHPPLIFIGYAATTIPFAAAIVYLLTEDDGWEGLSRQWARFTWLFLGMGIAVGGIWAYVALGWGGFWAWDPVETASFIPWLMLTGYLHAAALHRKNRTIFTIAAPIMAVATFILVLYATVVVRSGLFSSLHTFGETSTGTVMITAILIIALFSLALGMRRYFEAPESAEEDRGFWSKTNIIYITILLFSVLAFVSFWGISYPAFIQITQNVKVNVASDTRNFFNAWSYPFTLALFLAMGFCLNYKEAEKEKQKKALFIVIGVTILTMLLRTENFYVLDHNSPFWTREPEIYKLIGSISLLSIFPPMIYAAANVIEYFNGYIRSAALRVRVKGAGMTMVHFAAVLIILGAVVSSTNTLEIGYINIPIAAEGQLLDAGNDYGIKVVGLSSYSLAESSPATGTNTSGKYNVQSVKLEVYHRNDRIASGTAEYLEGGGTFPMVSPSLGLFAGDVYVIFQGTDNGYIPLTLRIIPAIDLTWTGIILFAVGMIVIMLVKSKGTI